METSLYLLKVDLSLCVYVEISNVDSAFTVSFYDIDSSPGETSEGNEGHLQNWVRYNANILIIFDTLTVGAKRMWDCKKYCMHRLGYTH